MPPQGPAQPDNGYVYVEFLSVPAMLIDARQTGKEPSGARALVLPGHPQIRNEPLLYRWHRKRESLTPGATCQN